MVFGLLAAQLFNKKHKTTLRNSTATPSPIHHQINHFSYTTQPRIDLDGVSFHANTLSKEKVTLPLNSMKPLGLDDFQYWHIVKDDIFELVKNAFALGYF